MKDCKPGSLFRSERKFHFCEVCPIDGIIKNNVYWKNRILVSKGDYLLFVQHHDLTEKTITPAPVPAAAIADAVADADTVAEVWDKAYDEWKKNKKIPGGIFLTPSGQAIWASHYVMDYLEKKS